MKLKLLALVFVVGAVQAQPRQPTQQFSDMMHLLLVDVGVWERTAQLTLTSKSPICEGWQQEARRGMREVGALMTEAESLREQGFESIGGSKLNIARLIIKTQLKVVRGYCKDVKFD